MATSGEPHDAHPDEPPRDDGGEGPPDDDAPPDDEASADSSQGDARDDRKGDDKRGRLEGFIPDIVKRTFYAGLGAVFTTEEGIRKIASDLKLPKDVANYLIQQAAASKDELFRVVGKELRGFLETVNVSGELQKLLTSLSFEIKTEIRFIPNDEALGGVKPDIKVGRMSFKRGKDDGKKPAEKDKPEKES
ncbi:MAG: hypothetical protein JWN44_2331 [Myxococcales bacterium]|nr:hypothetical protein [Myxococcales bacterium]